MRSVIVILGGGLHKNEHGVWQTNSYEDLGDNFGLDGHRLRVEAAAFILEDNPASVILASGGKGQYEDLPDSVPLSAVIKKELVEIGVLAEKIVEEDQSGSSYRQLTALDKLILEIWTDGTVEAQDALMESAKILMSFFAQVVNPKKVEKEK